jgi:hypothetical protein
MGSPWSISDRQKSSRREYDEQNLWPSRKSATTWLSEFNNARIFFAFPENYG